MYKIKILVADDSPTHLKLTAEPLMAKGYEVITAVDGDDAFEKVVENQPAVAVLDVIMPKLNGFQVCRKLKTSPNTKNTKVILLTSKGQESDKFWGVKQGADIYLVKPCSDADLLAAVEKLL